MPIKEFTNRLKDGEIKVIDEDINKEELEKIGPVFFKIEEGEMSYFLQGLCGVDLPNVGVKRIR